MSERSELARSSNMCEGAIPRLRMLLRNAAVGLASIFSEASESRGRSAVLLPM